MSDKIISLCYVSSKGERTTELCRIADYHEGSFLPYQFEPGNEFYDVERDLIYGSTAFLQVEEGSVAVFEWQAYLTPQNKWFTETSKSEHTWCEVISTRFGTIDELVSSLKSGFPMSGGYDHLHDLVLCCRTSGSQCDGLYIHKSDAFCRDGKLLINNEISSIVQVKLDMRFAVGECKCRSSRYDTRKYLAREDGCRVTANVELKTKDDIIGEIIRQNISKDVLARKERQAARAALEKLAMPSVIEAITIRLQCSSNQAAQYAEEYISHTREKLDATASQHLIELLIENDSDAVQHMRNVIQQQWDETQREQVKAMQQRRAAADAELDAVRKQIAEAENVLQEALRHQADVEKKTEEAFTLQEQIEAEIQKRLEQFRTNYASALVENEAVAAVVQTHKQPDIGTGNDSIRSKWMVTLPESHADKDTLNENLEAATEYWEDMCANQDMARGLALLSFAAYAEKQPLLVVGEGAIPISDLISSSICGRPAIKIHVTGESQNYQSIIEELEKMPEAVVCLMNGLKAGYDQVRELMQLCPHRMFVVIEMHAESLVMEPASLFTVFLPIFCDYFYTGKRVEELPTYDCSDELLAKADQISARSVKDGKAVVSRWFNGGFYPPMLKERCANIFAAMKLLSQTLGVSADHVMAMAIEFLFTPLLKCLHKEESLKSHLQECTVLDDDRKTNLISFISTED